MRKLIVVACILLFVFSVKYFSGNTKKSIDELGPVAFETDRQRDNGCMDIESFFVQFPDASSDEIARIEQCNKARAERLGLDKPGTGFLGNTYKQPEGSLAHYEGSGGDMIFTVYEDYILTKENFGSSGETKIMFSAVNTIEEAWDIPGTLLIHFMDIHGANLQYSLTLINSNDMIKAKGARDLDRLIALLKRQRAKFH